MTDTGMMSTIVPLAKPGSVPTPGPQSVRFCRTRAGARIAYAVHGEGPPLVVAGCWLSHLQHDLTSPVWRHFIEFLGTIATVIRYDEQGFGLSERDVDDFSLDTRVDALESVVAAAGFDRFALMGIAQGSPVAIAFAHRHPGRVDRLVFYGGYAAELPDPTAEQLDFARVLDGMVRVGWGRADAMFRRVFTAMMIPEGGETEMRWLDELQRLAVDADTLVRAREAGRSADTRALLPDLPMPALVLHSRDDRFAAFGHAVELATDLPDARLVPLASPNHIVLGDEPAWAEAKAELAMFLGSPEPAVSTDGLHERLAELTGRELEILRHAATGLDNQAVAEHLVLSVRTVERHMQNVYNKLGVTGRSARTAAVAALLRARP